MSKTASSSQKTKAPAKKAEKAVKKVVKKAEKPKRLSKIGEWMRRNPDGVIEVLDLKAVLR